MIYNIMLHYIILYCIVFVYLFICLHDQQIVPKVTWEMMLRFRRSPMSFNDNGLHFYIPELDIMPLSISSS